MKREWLNMDKPILPPWATSLHVIPHAVFKHLTLYSGPAAMVRLVRPWLYWFLREKSSVAWILFYACVIEWPLRTVCRSLGCLRGLLRTFSSLHASKVSIDGELRFLNHRCRNQRGDTGGTCPPPKFS